MGVASRKSWWREPAGAVPSDAQSERARAPGRAAQRMLLSRIAPMKNSTLRSKSGSVPTRVDFHVYGPPVEIDYFAHAGRWRPRWAATCT